MLPLGPTHLIRLVARAACAAAALLAMGAFIAVAHATDGIEGIWWSPEHDAKIEIVVDDTGTATGRLIAVERAHAGDRDEHNPDPALRVQTILGVTILRGFRQESDGTWTGGTLYDPENGRSYHGTLALDRDGRLRMRGYVGIELLGRTEVLPRVVGPSPAGPQPGEPDFVYVPR